MEEGKVTIEEVDIEEREEEREEIYSYLKCKICDGYFENAKILTECFHSFCLVCISQSAECLTQENHFSIACEICNTITTTPSLSLLPNNSISEKLLKNFKPPNNNKQVKLLSQPLYCDNEICKEENKKASLYCDNCGANYCENCWKTGHLFGVLQKHSPLLIHQKNNKKYCSTHLRKQMKFYCIPCDQLLCSLCWLDNHNNLPLQDNINNNNNNNLINNHNNNNNNNNNDINNNINDGNKNHHVTSMDKASEDIKKKLIITSDQILLYRPFVDKRIHQNKNKRDEINQSINHKKNHIEKLVREIEIVKVDIEKLEIEKEMIENTIKEDEFSSTQIEISNRMIKDMIQSLPSLLPVQKKYRDQIDLQISRVFESLYSFPLPQIIKYENDPYHIDNLCILNAQSFVGDVNKFALSNDGKKFIKTQEGDCGITVKKGISSGKYRWKILYDPIDQSGWFFIGVQLNKPICSSPTPYYEKESFGIVIYSIKYISSGCYYIEGKNVAPKETNLKVKSGEELEVIVDCDKAIFQLISSTFNHSIPLPILKQNQNYYLNFDPDRASFSLLSVEKLQ